MNPTVAAAIVGVGGTVIVGVAGFSAGIWGTRQTIAQARESRVWDKRAAAYEAALTEIVNRATKRQRWLRSSSQTWTAKNLAETLASQEKPEWSGAESRVLAYSSQQVLMALEAARSADDAVSQAFDRVGERLAAGEPQVAAGTLAWETLRDQVFPLLELVRAAANESVSRDEELIGLMQIELQGKHSTTNTWQSILGPPDPRRLAG